MIIRKTLLALTLCLAAAGMAQGQTMMEKAVIATGGGRSTTPTMGMDYTIGQPVVGVAVSPTTRGEFGFWSMSALVSSVGPEGGAGAVAALDISPNPVRTQSSISIGLAKSGPVDVVLYDVTGKAVATLFSGNRNAGSFSVKLDAAPLAAGTYFVAVSVPGAMIQRTVTVVK